MNAQEFINHRVKEGRDDPIAPQTGTRTLTDRAHTPIKKGVRKSRKDPDTKFGENNNLKRKEKSKGYNFNVLRNNHQYDMRSGLQA